MSMSTLDEIENDVYTAVADAEGGVSFNQIQTRTSHPPQDVRRAVKALLRQDDGIKVTGIEDREKMYGVE